MESAIPKTHGFGMPNADQKKRQKWPFLTTAGGMVFGMAGLAASERKWPPKRVVSRVTASLCVANGVFL
jgi:hypothetical protein